jgi:hypothetical protein
VLLRSGLVHIPEILRYDPRLISLQARACMRCGRWSTLAGKITPTRLLTATRTASSGPATARPSQKRQPALIVSPRRQRSPVLIFLARSQRHGTSPKSIFPLVSSPSTTSYIS